MGSLSTRGRKRNRPAVSVGQKTRSLQKSWADWLGRRTAHLKRIHWIIGLALFVLVAVGYNGYLMLGSFEGKGGNIFAIFPIQKPALVNQTREILSDTLQQLSSGEYERIHHFRLYMDSLVQSPSGKPIYDSILLNRPGLMDSVLFIEKHYGPNN